MSFTTALALCAMLGFTFGMSRVYFKHLRDYRNEATAWADLENRLENIERRMANLEALVLDDARDKRFEALHRE